MTEINLFGAYECTADDKGRVMLPASFKKQLTSLTNKGFVIKQSIFSKSLEMYPTASWNALAGEVNKLNKFVKKKERCEEKKLDDEAPLSRTAFAKKKHIFERSKGATVTSVVSRGAVRSRRIFRECGRRCGREFPSSLFDPAGRKVRVDWAGRRRAE